jgi:hypothetical protein
MAEHRMAERRWIFLSRTTLEEICSRVAQEFRLAPFEFDAEIDSRWGITERDGVGVNVTHWTVSRRERLEELHSGLPDYNFVLIFSMPEAIGDDQSPHWFLDRSIGELSRRFASLVGTEVFLVASKWGDTPVKCVRYEPGNAGGLA